MAQIKRIKLLRKEISLENKENSISNIYRLDGRVPIARAIPFGLQHILAMFVAGIATLIQLYPVWKIGSRLPVVMAVSFHLFTDNRRRASCRINSHQL